VRAGPGRTQARRPAYLVAQLRDQTLEPSPQLLGLVDQLPVGKGFPAHGFCAGRIKSDAALASGRQTSARSTHHKEKNQSLNPAAILWNSSINAAVFVRSTLACSL
jgi:hypothetical protein